MTRQIFIHTFKTGDVCTLVIEGDWMEGIGLKVKARWDKTPNWPRITEEYLTWRMEAVEQFMRACDAKE